MTTQKIVEVAGLQHYNGIPMLRNIVKDLGGVWDVNGYQNHPIYLTLIPEPDNEYDPNAIAVFSEYPTPEKARISRSGKIGYLPMGSDIKLDTSVSVKAIVKEGFGRVYVRIDISDLAPRYEEEDTWFQNDSSIPDYEPDEAPESVPFETVSPSAPFKITEGANKIPVNKFVFSFLAIFLGIFGIHWFYAKKYKRGALYLIFSWTSIPFFLGLYDGVKAFFSRTDTTYQIYR